MALAFAKIPPVHKHHFLHPLLAFAQHRINAAFSIAMAPLDVDVTKRVAVITGCSEPKSLGAAFSRELLARGWTVFATARKEATLSPLRDAGCHTLELDVCSDDSVNQATQRIVTLTGGRVDLLINNVRDRSSKLK